LGVDLTRSASYLAGAKNAKIFGSAIRLSVNPSPLGGLGGLGGFALITREFAVKSGSTQSHLGHALGVPRLRTKR
jgi:hypothetical protein